MELPNERSFISKEETNSLLLNSTKFQSLRQQSSSKSVLLETTENNPEEEGNPESLNLSRLQLTEEGQLTEEDIDVIVQEYVVNNVLVELNLTNNHITPQEIIPLAAALKHNTSLQIIILDRNNIGSKGVLVIVNGLENNKTLQTLSLNENNIDENGIQVLAATLRLPTLSLKELQLNYNKMGNGGARDLALALEHNSSLHALELDNNQIGTFGATALARMLLNNRDLESLSLGWNQIDDKGVIALADKLVWNTTLTSLFLRGNPTMNKCFKAFADALTVNYSLINFAFDRSSAYKHFLLSQTQTYDSSLAKEDDNLLFKIDAHLEFNRRINFAKYQLNWKNLQKTIHGLKLHFTVVSEIAINNAFEKYHQHSNQIEEIIAHADPIFVDKCRLIQKALIYHRMELAILLKEIDIITCLQLGLPHIDYTNNLAATLVEHCFAHLNILRKTFKTSRQAEILLLTLFSYASDQVKKQPQQLVNLLQVLSVPETTLAKGMYELIITNTTEEWLQYLQNYPLATEYKSKITMLITLSEELKQLHSGFATCELSCINEMYNLHDLKCQQFEMQLGELLKNPVILITTVNNKLFPGPHLSICLMNLVQYFSQKTPKQFLQNCLDIIELETLNDEEVEQFTLKIEEANTPAVNVTNQPMQSTQPEPELNAFVCQR